MTKYNSNYSPPAPVAVIIIRNPDTLESAHNVPMLLDTGADVTLLPKDTCSGIGLELTQDESLKLTAFDGTVSEAEFVYGDMIFLGKRFRGKFLLYDSKEGIIGRDILNKFQLLLDGPNLEWVQIETNNSTIS